MHTKLSLALHKLAQIKAGSTGARKNSLEMPKPRMNPREEPGYEGWPVLFWLYRVEIITEHGQDVQMFINDQHGQIIIITGRTVETGSSTAQVDWRQQGVIMPGSPEAWS